MNEQNKAHETSDNCIDKMMKDMKNNYILVLKRDYFDAHESYDDLDEQAQDVLHWHLNILFYSNKPHSIEEILDYVSFCPKAIVLQKLRILEQNGCIIFVDDKWKNRL